MKERDSFRGTDIDKTFTGKFKSSKFYKEIYEKHKNEIIIAVRDGFINLYYNCDSIAKIEAKSPNKATINTYYITGKSSKSSRKITDDELKSNYLNIKKNSDKRKKLEKQAQEKLFIANNINENSEWFCIDVEYTKSLKGKENAEHWRFDIVAITKKEPHRVALIELKYGKGAIQGTSGIRSHIKDFYSFYIEDKFSKMKLEIVSIIKSLKLLGVDIPKSLQHISSADKICSIPEFYFITLNNNEEDGQSNPKQTMSGCLFKDKRWGCKRVSSLIKKEGDYFDLIKHDKTFNPTFLFSDATLPDININSILD